jgi:tetratricopeptide (TPR) repeat protein
MAGYTFMFYIIKFIFPYDLCAIYPYPKLINGQLPSIYFIYSGISVLVAGLATIVIIKLKTLKKELLFGLAFFSVNIFLVLHLIPIEGRVIAAERYTYLAFLGLFFIIAILLNRVFTNPKTTRHLKIIVLSFFSIYIISFISTDISRSKVWKNGFTLFTDIINKMPDYDLAYNNRGTLYFNKGNYELALQDFDKAINVNPDFKLAYYNRALLYVNISDFANAISDCNKAVSIDTLYFDSYYLRAYSNNKSGKFNEAIADYNKVLKIKPDHLLAIYNRGNTRKNLKDYDGAIKDYTLAIKLKQDFPEAYNGRGVVKYFIGDYAGSLADYELALKYNPTNGNYFYNKALSELELNLSEEACASIRKSMDHGYQQAKELFLTNCK